MHRQGECIRESFLEEVGVQQGLKGRCWSYALAAECSFSDSVCSLHACLAGGCLPGSRSGLRAGRRGEELAEFIDEVGHPRGRRRPGPLSPGPASNGPRVALPTSLISGVEIPTSHPHHSRIIIINCSISEPRAQRCLGRVNKPAASSNVLLQSESAAEASQRRWLISGPCLSQPH